MKISSQDAQNIIFDTCYGTAFTVVKEGDWVSDVKYELNTTIFKFMNKYYELTVSRTGSPYTDWYYTWEYEDSFECPEVEKYEEVVIKWRKV